MPAQTAPVHVSKLAYVGFETPDVDRMVHHYAEVLDFAAVESDARRAYLTTTFDHHSLVFEKAAGRRSRSFVGFEIADELDDAERALREAGYAVERRTDIAPSTPDVLVVEEPLTGTPLHLIGGQARTGATDSTPLRPLKLGHVAAYTPQLKPTQDFYEELLGFRWSDTVGDFFVFLRCNSDHHAANFVASGKFRDMHHIAFEMRDLEHVQTMLDHLAAHDVRLDWGPGRHGPGHNIFTYHRDPDGNRVELFTQLDRIVDESLGYFEPRPWHEDRPQVPKHWGMDLPGVNSWGPIDFDQLDH